MICWLVRLYLRIAPTKSDGAMTGSLTLSENPGDLVRLSCEKCGRSGQYRKQKLIERYGADMRLTRSAGGNCTVRASWTDARRLHGSLR